VGPPHSANFQNENFGIKEAACRAVSWRAPRPANFQIQNLVTLDTRVDAHRLLIPPMTFFAVIPLSRRIVAVLVDVPADACGTGGATAGTPSGMRPR